MDSAKKSTEKALNALFILRRNLSKAKFWTRKNAYICYVVPILNYGSALWKPSKGDLGTLESIQRKAVSWIFITNNISYKDKLVKLDILPISLYQELHDILLFAKILTGKVDIGWRSQVTITDISTRRTQATRNFACQQIRLKKCESDYLVRACRVPVGHIWKFDLEKSRKYLILERNLIFQNFERNMSCTIFSRQLKIRKRNQNNFRAIAGKLESKNEWEIAIRNFRLYTIESRAVLLEIEDRVSPRERLLKLDQSEPSAERRTTGVSQRSKRTQILEHELILAVQTIKH